MRSPTWTKIREILLEELDHPPTILCVGHYMFKGTLCPLSLACWRLWRATPGGIVGAAAITCMPRNQIALMNNEYDARATEKFGRHNAIDGREAITIFIESLDYLRENWADLAERSRDEKELRRPSKLKFYDYPADARVVE